MSGRILRSVVSVHRRERNVTIEERIDSILADHENDRGYRMESLEEIAHYAVKLLRASVSIHGARQRGTVRRFLDAGEIPSDAAPEAGT
jgi:hypothetical protein